jgi:hypothetical protein
MAEGTEARLNSEDRLRMEAVEVRGGGWRKEVGEEE